MNELTFEFWGKRFQIDKWIKLRFSRIYITWPYLFQISYWTHVLAFPIYPVYIFWDFTEIHLYAIFFIFCREFTRVIIFTWTMSSIVLISSWRHLFCSLSRIISKLRSSLLILGFGLSSSSEISEGARSAREDISDWPSIEEGSHNEVSVSKNTRQFQAKKDFLNMSHRVPKEP